jgi:hypothetical protein
VFIAQTENANLASAYLLTLTMLDAFYDTYSEIASINDRPLLRMHHGHGKSPQGMGMSGTLFTQTHEGRSYYGFELYLPVGPASPLVVPSVAA